MIEYRSFLNTDSPGIVELWRKQPNFSRLSKTVTRQDLDLLVFGKPYFDPNGLIVAIENGQIVGFVHAGFGPDESQMDLDYETGVICQLRFRPESQSAELTRGLVDEGLRYLAKQGAKRCFAANQFPYVPFYLGLYGGSRFPGVVDDDHLMTNALVENGFAPTEQIQILQIQLGGFRMPVDRKQMTVRRQYQVAPIVDPMPSTWWNNCTFGMAETVAFRLVDRRKQEMVGSVNFWEIQPLSNEWGVRTMGMCDLNVSQELHEKGLGTFLVGQALTHLTQQSVGLCEAQVRQSNKPTIRVFEKLGFHQVATGTEYVREF